MEGCDKAYTTAANLRLHQKRHEEKISSQDESMEQEHASGIGPMVAFFLAAPGLGLHGRFLLRFPTKSFNIREFKLRVIRQTPGKEKFYGIRQ